MGQFPGKLSRGYQSFIEGPYRNDRERYAELAKSGQQPETMVIACCDSRVAPETVFNCGPGELFVTRNVANLVPPYAPDSGFHATSAAIEYAVQALQVKHIVVMGHGRCGGIQAVLDPSTEPLSAGDFIGNWVSMLAPLAQGLHSSGTLTQAERQTALERISVRNSLANIYTFPGIKEQCEQGKLELYGAWFDISSGELWVMDADSGEFEQLG